MKFWTTPKGKELTFKEFIQRWKEGINKAAINVSPMKQVNSQIKFTWIIVVGLVAGIIISITRAKTLWWVGVILFGALGNTVIQLIAFHQKKKMLEPMVMFSLGDMKGSEEAIKIGSKIMDEEFKRKMKGGKN